MSNNEQMGTELEFMIDDSFFYATNYKELKDSFHDILGKLLHEQAGKIEKVKELLGYKNLFIRDIAAMVGFSDQFYFARVFRAITGQSPSRYQQEQ